MIRRILRGNIRGGTGSIDLTSFTPLSSEWVNIADLGLNAGGRAFCFVKEWGKIYIAPSNIIYEIDVPDVTDLSTMQYNGANFSHGLSDNRHLSRIPGYDRLVLGSGSVRQVNVNRSNFALSTVSATIQTGRTIGDIHFSADETKLFISDYGNNAINSFPINGTIEEFVNVDFTTLLGSLATGQGLSYSLEFNPEGTELYSFNFYSLIRKFFLPTPWTLQGAELMAFGEVSYMAASYGFYIDWEQKKIIYKQDQIIKVYQFNYL